MTYTLLAFCNNLRLFSLNRSFSRNSRRFMMLRFISLFRYIIINYKASISFTFRPVASAICSMVITFMAFSFRAVSCFASLTPFP